MDIAKAISALDSPFRREILKILVERPVTVADVLSRLKAKGHVAKYRETVYRALEILVDSGLVEKYYDREKGLCYKLSLNRITIEIRKNGLEMGE